MESEAKFVPPISCCLVVLKFKCDMCACVCVCLIVFRYDPRCGCDDISLFVCLFSSLELRGG